ncbi:hypothetical protein GQ54DRAFT_255713 [Martensiomyces pterosporus]|nr:hypothetical protein GQ54DRAFT_255713 [Martensiomyces pterosporus]
MPRGEALVKSFLKDIDISLTAIELHARFVGYCSSKDPEVAAAAFDAFSKSFCLHNDIHVVVQEHSLNESQARSVLRGYFSVWSHATTPTRTAAKPALFSRSGARLMALFGGQGGMNDYIDEARWLLDVYSPLLSDFVVTMSEFLQQESEDPRLAHLYGRGLNLAGWLSFGSTLPELDYLLTVPVSIPLVGLIQLMHVMVAYKTLGVSPGELASAFTVATGHSQGIVIATALSLVTDEHSFYSVSQKALGILMLVGAMPQMEYPCIALRQDLKTDAVRNEGAPYPMVSILGPPQRVVKEFIASFNSSQPSNESHVHLALANTYSQHIVAGELESIVRFVKEIRSKVAAADEDQTRTQLSHRKPKASVSYVAITAPYHCALLGDVIDRQCSYAIAKGWVLDSQHMSIPVQGGEDGHDIRMEQDLTRYLFRSTCVLPVDWAAATEYPGLTHIVDFGPGGFSGFGSLTFRNVEGCGVPVICAGALVSRSSSRLGTKADLYKRCLCDVTSAPNWRKQFGPKLVCTAYDDKLHIDSPMHRVLGLPPLMVAGMTPTTTDESFVAAVARCGYHAELAGGGIYSASELDTKVSSIVSTTKPGQGITLNCIYISPKLWGFQYPAVLRMRREGVPVVGLCIGGGVPSTENAGEIITSLKSAGFRHVSFKPSSASAIRQVVAIAKANCDFPIILQWTGGRSGGHHSYEDFHEPILETYAAIRLQPNIVLVAGSGFGDAEGTLPYIMGDWSAAFGRAPMPFDGILLGSRVMVAKEARTSGSVKDTIVATPGLDDLEWEKTHDGPHGGIITITSEYGEKNHVIATRAALLADEIYRTILSQPRDKHLALLLARKDEIIDRLNKDSLRPWFGKKSDGRAVDLEEMTYAEAINRLVELMYVKHQLRWADTAYRNFVFDFIQRTERRLRDGGSSPHMQACSQIDNPFEFVARFIDAYPECQTETIASADVLYFVSLCKRRGQKPVPFIPVLDSDFGIWLYKDTTWQMNDLDAVVGQDAQRVGIPQGPVAAKYSTKANEPVKDILDGIYHRQVAALLARFYDGDRSKVPVVEYIGSEPAASLLPASVAFSASPSERCYTLPCDESLLPGLSCWFSALAGPRNNWLRALLTAPVIAQGSKLVDNYMRRVVRPRPGQTVTIEIDDGDEPISVEVVSSSGFKELELFIEDDGTISLSVFHRNHAVCRALCFDFFYSPSTPLAPIHEIMDGRDVRIQKFFIDIWLRDSEEPIDAHSSLSSGALVRSTGLAISKDRVGEYCRAIGNRSKHYPPNSKRATLAPMDYITIIASRNFFDRLTSETAHSGLLKGVHLFNTIRYVDGQGPLAIDDVVDCSTQITQITQIDAGKRILVEAHIYRNGTRVAEAECGFLCRDTHLDPALAFRRVKEPVVQVLLRSIEDVAVIESKEWFVYCNGTSRGVEAGSVLEFHLDSEYRYKSKAVYSRIATAGRVLLKTSANEPVHVADVSFECGHAIGNPVTEYLAANGAPLESTVLFEGGGYEVTTEPGDDPMAVVVHDNNWAYSLAAGDCNPIHSNPYAADLVGLPDTITHGMWTSASTRCFIERLVANDQPDRIRSYHVDLLGMVFPRDRLETKLFHVGMKGGRMLIHGKTYKGDDLVLQSTAEVDQPMTTYVFTGQGSQQVGMGMDLYERSSAARLIWDRADKHMVDTYGVSILHIVRHNPSELAVHFGGRHGCRVRDSYLALQTRISGSSCSARDTHQVLRGLTSDSDMYTFKSPTGLLNVTQFTQAAVVAFELAAIGDLRSRSLVRCDAAFAGHSLGELGALAAIGEIASVEDAIDIAFCRGMVMQSFVERDVYSRSRYAMTAVDPSRVGGAFGEGCLDFVVAAIRKRGQGLLEIVNYNIQGLQYIVAGSLAQLSALRTVLDTIAARELDATACSFKEAVAELVTAVISQGAASTALERGRGTTPLTGIDIPFHSTHLLPGVEILRSYLLEKIRATCVDYGCLKHRYIPNLTAEPFEVSESYFKMVYQATGSPSIHKELSCWNDSLLGDKVETSRLAHILLVELLAYQIASPVSWISTQDRIFREMRTERFIEIGPSATLCGIAAKSLSTSTPLRQNVSILHISQDESAIHYSVDPCTEPEPAIQQPPHVANASEAEVHTELSTMAPQSPASLQPIHTAPSAEIADEQPNAIDVVQAIIAHKTKRHLDEIQTSKSIKELAGGKSTLQNEIIGDLHSEFGGKVPDKAEDLPLHDLASSLGTFSGALGKHTSMHIARMFSSKMPGGFTQSAARNTLRTLYGLGPLRQDALLLTGLTMEPATRLSGEADAKAWLDSVVQTYSKRAGVTYSSANASASGASGSTATAVINSTEFNKAQREQREHVLQQIQLLARFAGVDLREGARSSETAKSELVHCQSELDEINGELGSDYISGVKGVFDIRMARRYDSSWNWARQDALEWIYSVLSGKEQSSHDQASDGARLHALANRSTPGLLSLVAATISAMEKSSSESSPQAVGVAKRIYAACKEALDLAPVYKEMSVPTCPNTRISNKGDIEYSEIPREDEPSFVEYAQHMKAPAFETKPPLLHLRGPQNEGGWLYNAQLSELYFNALAQMSTMGLSFARKTALVTGCGRGSIGADILRGLLAGGARVVATTSSYSRKTTLFYEEMYRDHGARGSELIVVPFNQGSTADITALVEYIFGSSAGSKGLGWDLDFVFPFAAISEVGSDVTGLGSRSELAHRIMLTNVLRLLGEIKEAKERLLYRSRPSLAVLPLSPNHGDFGGDGLYGESKIGLETAFNRWHSESWTDYLSIAGAVIGWTRGTGLMSGNNAVAQKIESHGVRTFSTREMAFNILALLHSKVVRATQAAPVWADFNGGLQHICSTSGVVAQIRQSLSDKCSKIKAANMEFANDYIATSGREFEHMYREAGSTCLASHKLHFPSPKSYEQLEQLRHLQGMANLDKVVVVTGYGEVGPFGSAENRWEMEAFGEFSLEGCIELAWVMGLIRYHRGPLAGTDVVYTGWADAKTGEPVRDTDVKARYEEHILKHTGIRLIEPEMIGGYNPNRKQFMRELQIEHDMEAFEATADEAAAFKLQNGDKVDVWANRDGSWSVRFLKGAVIHVPKALRFDRLVAAQLPTGWNPARYGIPEDVIKQVDPITCYALVAAVEALMRSGITDPYELYRYFHVSEVGSTIGSAVGGPKYTRDVFRMRFQDKDCRNDSLQEMFINTTAAWINMLLLSSSGPIKPTVGACATAVLSIDVAVETIQSGKAKVVLAGGLETFIEESSYEFAQMGATSNSVEELASGRTPKEMCRPCTSTRNGFMEGEGAGIVTLMSASAAIEFGAPIHGILAMTSTATDKQGSSVPAPGQGVLTSARETATAASPRLLDFSYRRRQLGRRLAAIDKWVKDETDELVDSTSDDVAQIMSEAERQKSEALDTWGSEFWKHNTRISPIRGSLAVWGLTVDDIGVASFHGTSTVANDKNESEVLNRQMEHLGRTPGLAVPAVCQKWLTGHSKGAAAAFMLNGVLQSLRTGTIPGNRNADNIAAELEKFEYIVYPSHSIQTSGIKAGLLKSFGFGQVGGEILVVHPDYLLAALTREELEQYNEKLQEREAKSYRYWQDTLVGNHPFIQIKAAPPYALEQEQSVYLDPLARATLEPESKQFVF